MRKIKIIFIITILIISVFFSGCIESQNNGNNTINNNDNNETINDNTNENMIPVAVATAIPTTGAAPLTVYFNSSGSYDLDGVITTYKWDLGLGPRIDPSKNPINSYMDPGNYTVKLYVQDNDGAWSSASVINLTVT